jgi:hypothetical protein
MRGTLARSIEEFHEHSETRPVTGPEPTSPSGLRRLRAAHVFGMTPQTSAGTPTLITVPAANLTRGDLLHYNAHEAWRVEGLSLFGKSVDVTFVYELCEAGATGRVGEVGEHRFRQSTNVLVLRTLKNAKVPAVEVDVPVTVSADDLIIGDVVHYNAAESWRVTALDVVGKSLDTDFTWVRSELDPGRVGVFGSHRFRRSTKLLVTRA